MGDKSKIEWTEATWNTLTGCKKLSPGCKECYAIRFAHRLQGSNKHYQYITEMINGKPEWTGNNAIVYSRMTEPLRWKKPRRIFVNSMSDTFIENVADRYVAQIFAIMAMCPQHTFQVLTKRAKRMWSFLNLAGFRDLIQLHLDQFSEKNFGMLKSPYRIESCWPLPNVWLGVSVEDQKTADERIPQLLQTPSAVRWISAEPLLGHIDLDKIVTGCGQRPLHCACSPDTGCGCAKLNWVVAGGESGPNARPSHPDWFRSMRDQCIEYDIPFFFKQWGEHDSQQNRIGKKAAGRLLDDKTWNQYPNLEHILA